MTSEQFIKFREMIEREYSNAVTKHPKFCDYFINNLSNWDRLEHMMKVENSEHPEYAENVLLEEFAEAMNAYQHGDKKQCFKELAQCGAVILRMMEFVQKEIEK